MQWRRPNNAGRRFDTAHPAMALPMVRWSATITAFDGWLTAKRVRVYSTVLLLVAVIGYAASMLAGDFPLDAFGNPFAADFSAQVTAGRMAIDGRLDQLYDIGLQRDVQQSIIDGIAPDFLNIFISPPHVAYIYAPFARLPYFPAAVSWLVLSLILVAISLRLMWPLTPRLHRHGYRQVLVTVVAAPPVIECLESGQDSAVSLLLMSLGVRLLLDRRDFAAGAVLGLGVFKPQLFLLLPVVLLFQRRWRAVGSFVLISSLFAVADFAILGRSGTQGYAHLLSSDLYVEGIAKPLSWKMQSLPPVGQAVAPERCRTIITLLFLALGVVGVAGLCRTMGGRARLNVDWEARLYAATILVTALVDPHFFLYDCTILVVPALILLSEPIVTPGTRVAIVAIICFTLAAPALHRIASLAAPLRVIDVPWAVIPIVALLVISRRFVEDRANLVTGPTSDRGNHA